MSKRSRLALLFFAISFLPTLIISILTYNNYARLLETDKFNTLDFISDYMDSPSGIPIENALRHSTGQGHSVDYRREWGFVAKIDTGEEALTGLRFLRDTLSITLAILLALCLLVSYIIANTLSKYRDHLEDLVKERTSRISELTKNIEFILAATKTGLDIIDADYNMVYIDPAWQKIYGEAKGKKCYKYFMGRDKVCPACGIKRALEEKKPVVTEEVLVKEGNRPVQVTTMPYQDKDGNWLVAEINVDITDRKRAGEELDRYRQNLEELVEKRTGEMRESEERFRVIFDESSDGLLLADPETRQFTMCNNAICEMLGYTKDELLKLKVDGIHPADSLAFVLDQFEDQARGVLKLAASLPVLKKDGSIFYADVTTTHISLKGKKYLLGSFRDITERRGAEMAIAASETRYRRLFESAKDGILILNAESGKIIDANPFIKDLLGYPAEELIGKELWEIGAFRDISDSKKAFLELQNKGYVRYENLPLEAKNGEVKEVEFVSNRYPVDHTNVLQCNIRDITERRRAEAALEISEANYRSIFELASDAIIVRDIESYEIVDANEQACEIFCYPKQELLGTTPDALLPDEAPNNWEYLKPIYDKAAAGEPQSVEVMLKDKAGRTFWAEAHMKRAVIGGMYRLLSIAHDISERKGAQQKIIELNNSIATANEDLKRLALIDPHTGLYNYHYYSGVIEAEFSRAERQDTQLSLIMMDIDYFKSINDVYGHQFGDLVLKQLAELLKKTVRLYDTVIRFGGEEFLIIAPGAGNREALILAKRLLKAVEEHRFGDSAHDVKLKVSAAVGSYPEDLRIKKSSDFIDIADGILNRVKEEGGNRAYSSLDMGISEKDAALMDETSATALKDKIWKLTARGNQSVAEAIFAFAKTIELKDHYTGEHVDDTMYYAINIAEKLGLSAHEVETIKYAAALHDLGKVGIPESILHKKGKLTEKEYEIIKKHPQIGADILRPIHFLHDIIPALLHHHERWDGKGYPSGLKGHMIPLSARIIAVADSYQAMTSNRPYKKAVSEKEALEALKAGSGEQFDPMVVKTFLTVLKEKKNTGKYKK